MWYIQQKSTQELLELVKSKSSHDPYRWARCGFERSCIVSFLLSLCFKIRDYFADPPFDKVTVSNDCSEKKVQDSFFFSPFFCIATPSIPLGITTTARLHKRKMYCCRGLWFSLMCYISWQCSGWGCCFFKLVELHPATHNCLLVLNLK